MISLCVCVALQLFDGCPDSVAQNCNSPPVVNEPSDKQQVVTGGWCSMLNAASMPLIVIYNKTKQYR